ncbi:MAG: DNA adenine methylase [Coleofasciculaceae cyanobacterium SM2_1_6]|nr:DNA adenine methylase [Coleofasciculaceae cyanobacterium SM2_1_6]
MNQSINSPFRYAGGKFYARKLILEYIPYHVSYVEPFAGGASIFFAKAKSLQNWINDIDKDVVNVYIHIRDYPEQLASALSEEVATKERHEFYKNQFIPQNDLERAIRWYYLNRTSYSGIMNMKNCYWGYGEKYSMRPENWGKNIFRTSDKLQKVKITNLDFEQVIDGAEDGAFLFIDPPYFNADQDKFYSHSFSKEDHFRLQGILLKHRHRVNFLLTYDNCIEIKNMYKWANSINEKEWNYTINRTDDQKLTQQVKNGKIVNGTPKKGSRSMGKEIFIINYDIEVTSSSFYQLSLML